ncbi:MAG: exopolysaccharide biosynthesis protein [Verrucomicrobia bacterium]|nr:exopolysaccharide biosynthesis protein [Verrucomicrobiota bacterium]MBS0645696.1 exopolysaccharide biosynthesis protein [Verrucomicrobiota bacterium]
MAKKSDSLEDHLKKLILSTQKEKISLAEIITSLSHSGRPLIIFFLVLPFCQPLVPPGLSVPFGLIIALLGARMTSKYPIWLPKWLISKQISTHVLHKITHAFLRILHKMRSLIRPRLFWISRPHVAKQCNGWLIFLLGVLLAIPFPLPLINLVSAWPIFFIILGSLEEDGIFILIGYIASLAALIFYSSLIFSVGSLTCKFFEHHAC